MKPHSQTSLILSDLELFMSIGIYEHEKAQKQRVIINAEVVLTQNLSFHKDTITDTLNYEELLLTIEKISQDRHFDLIENFAENISDSVLKHDHAKAIHLKIEKPEIFADRTMRSLGITYSKTKP